MNTKSNLLQMFRLGTVLLAMTADIGADCFLYSVENGTVTICGYTGCGGAVSIPCTICVGDVNMPVARIGDAAFDSCTSVTSITIPASVTSIGDAAFFYCTSLSRITMPDSLISIGDAAFQFCPSLINITIPASITNLGCAVFKYSTNLMGIYFKGNVPNCGFDEDLFFADNKATVYYLPGTTGWGETFGGRQTVLWNPRAQTLDTSFGVRTNRFGFHITGSRNLVIVVEACTDLANPVWSPVSTNTLNTFIGTNGTSYFRDPDWTNYPSRFYRLRSP